MSTIHAVFLAATCLAPWALARASRRLKSAAFDRGVERGIAGLLLATEAGQFLFKVLIERLPLVETLPLQLCDWALLATAAALWWQSSRCFELAYFWGLAGTVQGLITPALDPAHPAWRHLVFFIVHSGIVVGVLFLVFAKRMRPWPGSLPRVLLWSGIYCLVALTVNALTDQNYGFLSHPPATASLLDLFPESGWLYVATICGVGLAAFALLYLPWWIRDQRRAIRCG